MRMCESYRECTKNMKITQVLLPQEDDELVGVSSLKLVDELDEDAVAVLAKMLGVQVRQLILGLYVVDTDFALLHHLLHEKVPQRDVLCARTVGAVARRTAPTCCRCTAARFPSSRQSPAPMLCWSRTLSSSLSELPPRALPPSWTVRSARCSPTLKLIGALAGITMYDDVDLPLSGLLP